MVFILLGCTALYLFLMNTLQRNASIKSYLAQDYSETNNIFQSWVVIGIINALLVTTLISQYIPVVPKQIADIKLFGFEANKFGFTLLAVSIFYLAKSIFSYFFFQTLGVGRNWNLFCYVSSKFYLLLSLLLVILCYSHYFLGIDFRGDFYSIQSSHIFPIYLFLGGILLFFKNLYFLFNKNRILPFEWYYKILYICTLQIAPVLALWKLIFI